MTKLINTMVAKLHSKQDGVTALEYALIAALIAVVIIGGVTLAGQNTNSTFTSVAGQLPN